MGLLDWLTGRTVRSEPGAGTERTLPPQPVEHRPPPTDLQRLSGDGRVPIVGESQYQPALRTAARGKAHSTDFDDHSPVDVVLVPEPHNIHDRFAVRVDALLPDGSATIGYLAREWASVYQPRLRPGTRPGAAAWCVGRVTGGGPKSYGAYLYLGPPESMFLANDLPANAELLPADRAVTVTGEERHQAALSRYGLASGGHLRLFATFDLATVTKGKYAGQPCIRVLLDGEPVGELTRAMSDRYLPALHSVQSQGRVAACEALLSSGARGLQVELCLPQA